MVRFHWPSSDGQNSFVPPGGVEKNDDGVVHINCEMELSGQIETCPALITLPSNYLEEGSIKNVGIVLAHGTNAEDQRGPFLTVLTNRLAKQGHVVVRYFCKQKEQRRQRILERTFDTVATCPYARAVKQWVFVGHENGARIAAHVGYKSLRPKHAFIFLSYPLLDPAPPPPKQKAGAEPPADSIGPLIKLIESIKVPQLYICGELDYDCPGGDLKKLGPVLKQAGVDARAVILPSVDSHFLAPETTEISPEIQEQILSTIEKYINSIENNNSNSSLPVFDDIEPSTRVPPRPVQESLVRQEEGEEEEMDVGHDDAQQHEQKHAFSGLTPAQSAALIQQRALLAAQQYNALAQMAMMQQQMAAANAASNLGFSGANRNGMESNPDTSNTLVAQHEQQQQR